MPLFLGDVFSSLSNLLKYASKALLYFLEYGSLPLSLSPEGEWAWSLVGRDGPLGNRRLVIISCSQQ